MTCLLPHLNTISFCEVSHWRESFWVHDLAWYWMKAFSSALWKMHLDLMGMNTVRVCIIVSTLQWDCFLFQFEMLTALSQSRHISIWFYLHLQCGILARPVLVYLYCADTLLSQSSLNCLRWVSHWGKCQLYKIKKHHECMVIICQLNVWVNFSTVITVNHFRHVLLLGRVCTCTTVAEIAAGSVLSRTWSFCDITAVSNDYANICKAYALLKSVH